MSTRLHTSGALKVVGPTGNLTVKQVRRTNESTVVAGPDPFEGHVTHIGGAQAYLPSTGIDHLETNLNESEATANQKDFGDPGRLEKTSGTIVPRPTENEFLSDNNTPAGGRGKSFSARIPFEL